MGLRKLLQVIKLMGLAGDVPLFILCNLNEGILCADVIGRDRINGCCLIRCDRYPELLKACLCLMPIIIINRHGGDAALDAICNGAVILPRHLSGHTQ